MFRSWLLRSPQMDPSKLLRASNDGKVEWNTIRCNLPVAYQEYASVILVSDWLQAWDKTIFIHV